MYSIIIARLDDTSFLLPLGLALDEAAKITNWESEREVHRLQHHGEPQVPGKEGGDEDEGATNNGEFVSLFSVAHSRIVVAGCQAWEDDDEAEEDAEEADVGSERANKIGEAEDSHPDEEDGECVVKAGWFSVASDGIVERLNCGTEGSPKPTEGEEDNRWERVAQDPFANTTGIQADGSQEVERATIKY